ncbi:DNA internalization-related competence protein ComEC/Rec2 [Anaerocolumna sp. MB42-C2]|uniref:DNA internalization-related competence protein ComEC/Rec2 n=1 Tax=Anaerocolumna sp. MB42-C2 TaxID=3070997 RepID=UPI0027E022B7|nr:DNA internalization-related competence protein ComEC/Rec2 [Anaerocolumna sp. MB42-C2]WMJ87747.1 DNA internalization-related competence protein ComEC/Rec2 [Anaerocolumna sp. MB42-C2]
MNIKRPLVWMLAFYLAGLTLYSLLSSYIFIIGGISFILIALWLLLPKNKQRIANNYFLLCLPLLFILGFYRMNLQLSPGSIDDLFVSEVSGTVQGQLVMIQNKGEYQVLTLKHNMISLNNIYKYINGKITIYTSSKDQYKIGNILFAEGDIKKFQKASNPGQFNEYQYNRMLYIYYKMNADVINIINHKYSIFPQVLYDIKIKLVEVYNKMLPKKNAGILSAMILGEISLLDPEIKQLYQQSGISHILAISGLHVSLLGLCLFQFLKHLKIPLILNAGISIFIIFSYGVLTNFSVSTNRAVVMLIILIFAGLIGRTYDLLSATAISALLILIQSPLQITNAGFLLSFGAILGIGLVNPILSVLIPYRNNFWDGLKTSISIQIITLPIILYFFYEFPTYSVLINMIILPSSSIIILLAILAGLIGCINLPLGVVMIGGVHYLLNFYEWICREASKLPFRTFLMGRPDLWILIAYYIIVLLLIYFYKKIKRKICVLLLSFLVIIFMKSKPLSLTVTFLDVGQGDGIFLLSPSGTTYMIDGGSSDVSKVGQYRLAPFFKANGIEALDYAIVTHMDSDHISGLKELIKGMEDSNGIKSPTIYKGNIMIRNLLLPDILKKDEVYEELVSMAEEKGIKITYIKRGDSIKDGDIYFNCLHPDANYSFTSRNAYSTVLSISYKEFDLLLTGDLEADGEEMVLQELSDQAGFTDNNYMENTKIINNDSAIVSNYKRQPATDYDILNKKVTRLIQFRFPCSAMKTA